MKNYYKNILVLTFILFVSLDSYAQAIPDYSDVPPSQSIGWVHNYGQVKTTNDDSIPEILFHSVNTYPLNYFFNNKISFVTCDVDTIQSDSDDLSRIDMTWIGENASPSTPSASEAISEKISYYLGHCPTNCGQLTIYNRLVYEDIYPNIDLHIYSNNEAIKIYFVVNPGGDPHDIKLEFGGQDDMIVDPIYLLLKFTLSGHELIIPNGIVYQVDGGGAVSDVGWSNTFTSPASNQVTFAVGSYDDTKTLVYEFSSGGQTQISNIKNLEWSQLMGGNGTTTFWDVKTNSSGQPYVSGYTSSTNFPATTGPYHGQNAGATDAIIVKFDNHANFNRTIWSTIIGGNNYDGLDFYGIDVYDNDAYVMFTAQGAGVSDHIPTYDMGGGALYITTQPTTGTKVNQFVAKFAASNGSYSWGTWLNTNLAEVDYRNDITLDANGNIFIAGNQVAGMNHVYTVGSPAHEDNTSTRTAFVGRFNHSDYSLDWLQGLGLGAAVIQSIEVDHSNNLIAVGASIDGGVSPIHPSSSDNRAYNAGGDAFIARFNTDLSLYWYAYFGGTSNDEFVKVAVKDNDEIVAVGRTTSTSGMPARAGNAVNGSFGGGASDGLIVSYTSGLALDYISLVGGDDDDRLNAISSRHGESPNPDFDEVVIGGFTRSNETTFPFMTSPAQASWLYGDLAINGDQDAVIVGLNTSYDQKWSTYQGGDAEDVIWGSDCGTNQYYYVVGNVTSVNRFPMVNFNPALGMGSAFIQCYSLGDNNMSVKTINKGNEQVQIYPNPAIESVNISLDRRSSQSIKNVKIFNIFGEEILTKESNNKHSTINVPVDNLSHGIYFIELMDSDMKKYVGKFTK